MTMITALTPSQIQDNTGNYTIYGENHWNILPKKENKSLPLLLMESLDDENCQKVVERAKEIHHEECQTPTRQVTMDSDFSSNNTTGGAT